MNITFLLAQQAKKAGGDKYISSDNPDFVIYIPQNISRNSDGLVNKKLLMSIMTEEPGSETEGVLVSFLLAQQAKKAGGDKYISSDNPDFSIYFPQSISRNDSSVHKKLFVLIKSL